MKRQHIFAALAVMAIASCAKTEIQEDRGISAPVITASIHSDSPGVKTSISVDQEGVGTIFWQPADRVNIFFGTTSVLYTSTNTEPATTVVFNPMSMIGSTESASTNRWGLYPYDEKATCDGNSVTTTILPAQNGVPETFDNETFTMLGHSADNMITFYNVCGGIKFSLNRNDIEKITFKGNNNEDLAGKVKLEMDDEGHPKATVVAGQKTITLTPKTGTTFASGTYYYIITLPVVLSSGFTMTFETATEIGTFNYTEKAVTVTRSKFGKKADIDSYASFVDKNPSAINLSENGTANCYIVSETGKYKFKTVQGNSNTSVGDVKGVKVLWESFGTNVAPTIGDLIKPDVSYADGYITFSTNDSYKEGNAVIAVYSDADCTDGNVLWSWHIWLTDQPEEQVYYNNAGTMMDRNLGATSATPGDVHALGLLYQWGRKDPFLCSSSIFNTNVSASTIDWPGPIKSSATTGSVGYSIKHPTTIIYEYDEDDMTPWLYFSNNVVNLWSSSKTIYDPCPSGWRLPDGSHHSIWRKALGFGTAYNFESTKITTHYDVINRGYNFGRSSYYSLTKDTNCWYPIGGMIYGDNDGRLGSTGYYGGYWTSSEDDRVWADCGLSLYGNTNVSSSTTLNLIGKSSGASVRCQKIQ